MARIDRSHFSTKTRIVRQGKSVRSKVKTSVNARGKEIISDVLEYNLSGDLRQSAEEARKEIHKVIKAVRTKAKPSTIRRRKYKKADNLNLAFSVHSGGDTSGRLFNDTGYFADKLVVAPLGKDWVVAAPVGRLEAPRSGRGARGGKYIRRIRNKANKELDLKLAAKLAPAATNEELKAMVRVIRRVRKQQTGRRNRF